MKKLAMLMVLCVAAVVFSGCGLTETYGEREVRYVTITDLNLRMAVDDWDHIWLAERNSYLTQWHPMVGSD